MGTQGMPWKILHGVRSPIEAFVPVLSRKSRGEEINRKGLGERRPFLCSWGKRKLDAKDPGSIRLVILWN